MHPAITLEPCFCDDRLNKARYGKEIGASFHCGDVELYVPYAADQPVQMLFRDSDHVLETEMHAAHILLTDPEIQAAIAHKKRAQLAPAAAPGLKPIEIAPRCMVDEGNVFTWIDFVWRGAAQ